MSVRSARPFKALALATVAGVLGCEQGDTLQLDAGAMLVLREGGQVPEEVVEPRADGGEEPPPSSSLDELLAIASGAVRGTVTSLRVRALTEEGKAAGINWRIHFDRVELLTTSSIGVGRVPEMSAYLIPVECEAFDDEGVPLPDRRLSTCTGRNEHNSPEVGEDLIALFSRRPVKPL